MSGPTASLPQPDAQAPRVFRLYFGALSLAALAALSLSQLRILDWSILLHAGVPRAELLGATLGTLGFWGWVAAKRGRIAWRVAFAAGLMPPLCAATFTTWEAITLVLSPNTLTPGVLHDLLEPNATFGVANTSILRSELVTIGVSLTTASTFFVFVKSQCGKARWGRDTLHAVTFSVLAAAIVTLLLPVAGPAHGVLPLPSAMDATADAHAADVPRTGAVCLPVVLLCSLLWSIWRHRDHYRVPLGLTALVIALELLTGRYSIPSLLIAGLLGVGLSRLWFSLVHGSSELEHSATADVQRVEASDSVVARQVRALLTVVFFFSGMAALVYQVVFAKGLALTFGSTSHASTIVLATYMGGLALGSWLGGRWAANMARPVVAYALAELGIAGICAVAPFTLRAARYCYVTLAQGSAPSDPWLIVLQLGMGALVLIPPTALMGLTLPLLTRQFLDEKNNLGNSAGLLYTANTLGAAVGACVTGYFVLPQLGISKSLWLAVFANVLVAACALLAAQWRRPPTSATHSVPVAAAAMRQDNGDPTRARQLAYIATTQLTVGGFVTFGLETTFIHLLATVAGTSAYAFSLMLFAFLVGLSLGSSLGRKWLPQPRHLPLALLLCQLALAVTLLVASRFWDYLPAYFASFGRWPYTLTFAAREFVRFVVCLAVMLPPAVCIGAQFPIAMQAVGVGWPKARIQALGRASALNTVGNILGALVVGFVALPRLGSHRTLALLTFVCLALAALALIAIARDRQRVWFGLIVAATVVLLLQPPQFDLTRLSSGGNVYFRHQYYGEVIDHTESLDGGLTAVTLSRESAEFSFKTLLTNGKFQGNNRVDVNGEMMAQTSFAVAPLLHTAQRDRALVIGFGTGTTTRVLDEAGFGQVVVAELSGDIIALADRHFSAINHGVVHQPNVRVHVTDGRNFLLLDRQRYDLIGIELSSIWFAGAANLYNDEFYALVERRLSELGVLQQWLQLHRLSHRDILSVLVTLRQRFPRIWLYFLGKQGILVGCKYDCLPGTDTLQRLRQAPRLEPTLALFPRGLNSVLEGRMLTPEGIDRLIDDYQATTKHTLEDLISTDDNLFLEYSTPKGNVREYDESIADNEAFLARFRAENPFESTRLELNAAN